MTNQEFFEWLMEQNARERAAMARNHEAFLRAVRPPSVWWFVLTAVAMMTALAFLGR